MCVQRAPPIVRRWVPFVAVAAANVINIPVMRQRELLDGIIVTDKEGRDLAKSKVLCHTRALLLGMMVLLSSTRWLLGWGYPS